MEFLFGLILAAVNAYAGMQRMATYKHSTNCVTKGLSDAYSFIRERIVFIISIWGTLFLLLLTILCKWSFFGVIIAVAGMFIPPVILMIQGKDKDYIKNQRRLTKGGLRVTAKSSGAIAGGVTLAATGGNVLAAEAAYEAGKGLGKGFDAAADNMKDVDMDYEAPDVDGAIKKAYTKVAATPISELPEFNTPSESNWKHTEVKQNEVVAIDTSKDTGHDKSALPSDQSERTTILMNYLMDIGFKQEEVNAASYEKLISAIAEPVAGRKNPMIKILNAEGFSDEEAALYLAKNGGAL